MQHPLAVLVPPTREEQKEEGEKMQARLANNLHACFHHA